MQIARMMALVVLGLAISALGAVDFDAPQPEVAGEQIYQCDFTHATQSAVRERGGKGTIAGVIHPDWSLDNSANFPNKVTATVMEDDGMTQRTFWRIESVKIERHNRDLILLWQNPIIPIPEGGKHMLRIRMRVRGTPGVRVRVNGTPRSTQAEFVLQGQWQDKVLMLPIYPDKKDADAKFALRMDVDGSGHDAVTLDLTELEVRAVSSEAVSDAVKKAMPAGMSLANAMRTTRFPLGLPFGWTPVTMDYPSLFFKATADPRTVGPSGFPTLKVEAASDDLGYLNGKGRGLRFTSAPLMILDPSQPHVFSTYVKGRGELEVSVRLNWKPRAAVQVTLDGSDQWQRVEVPFTPTLMDNQPLAAWFTVDTKPGEAIWFDAMQLEAGEKASDYKTQLQAEVQVNVEPQHRVQFDDEPAVVQWATTGASAGATLHLRVINSYGQSASLEAIQLDGSPLQQGVADYVKWPDRPLGQYRVEGWIERGGERVSPYDEVLVMRVRRPRYWGKDAPNSAFGGHFDAHPTIAGAAKAIGMNWVRDWDSKWSELQPDEKQWRDRKARIQAYRDAHIKVLAVMSSVPKWAQLQVEGLKPTDYPRTLSLYGDYIERFLRFHEGNIAAIEVFNEPWISRHFNQGVPIAGGKYVDWDNPYQKFDDLTRVAHERVQKVAPDVLTVGINTNQANRQWTEGMLSVEGLKHCDVASYHMYALGQGIPGDTYEWAIREALDPIEKARPGFPVWMTEGSPTAHNMGTGLVERIAPGHQEDNGIRLRSDRHIRYALTPLARGVDRLFYYTMGGGRFYQPKDWGWGILMDGSGTLWPEAAAFSNMAWHLEETQFVGTHKLDERTYLYLFKRTTGQGGVGVLVYDLAATTVPSRPLPNADDVTCRDIFGNVLTPGSIMPAEATFITTSGDTTRIVQAFNP